MKTSAQLNLQQNVSPFHSDSSMSSMKEVHAHIENILRTTVSEDVLVAYDVDVTLTVCEDPHTHMPNIYEHSEEFEGIFSRLSPENKDQIWSSLLQEVKSLLIEEDTPQFISKLQEQGAKVIALTAILSGHANAGLNVPEIKRFHDLKSFGFDFSSSFPHIDHVSLSTVPLYLDRHPAFYKGVLASNGEGHDINTKGPALVAFLKHIDWQPKAVVFVDDKLPNFPSVRNALHALNPHIQFTGIHYTGGLSFSTRSVQKDEFLTFWKKWVS